MSIDFQDSNPESLISWASPVPLCHSVPADHQCTLVFIPFYTLQSTLTSESPLLAPDYLSGHILWQNIQLVYYLPTYAFISQDIPTFPYLCCIHTGFKRISQYIPTYPYICFGYSGFVGISRDNLMSVITQAFLEYPLCSCLFLGYHIQTTGAS